MKKKTKKVVGWMKIMDLIEEEIELFDKRPKKERSTHPSGECYINDIMNEIEKMCDVAANKALKVVGDYILEEFNEGKVQGPGRRVVESATKITKIKLQIK